MKLPIIGDGLSPDRAGMAVRTVPRIKRSLATSLCAGGSVSWAQAPRTGSPYHYGDGCFCLSPERHGAQFRQDGWEVGSLKGNC
jgi:hypothetical protein